MRRCAARLQGRPPGFNPGSILQQMGKSPAGSGGFSGGFPPMMGGMPMMMPMGGGGAMPPEMMERLKHATGGMNLQDIVAQAQKMAMQDGAGSGGPKMGVYMMGQGVDERGKRVARAAKMVKDLNTGKVEKDFVEKQLDPDDPLLPKETVEEYNTADAIEIDLDAPKVEGETGEKPAAPPEEIAEAEIVFERADRGDAPKYLVSVLCLRREKLLVSTVRRVANSQKGEKGSKCCLPCGVLPLVRRPELPPQPSAVP